MSTCPSPFGPTHAGPSSAGLGQRELQVGHGVVADRTQPGKPREGELQSGTYSGFAGMRSVIARVSVASSPLGSGGGSPWYHADPISTYSWRLSLPISPPIARASTVDLPRVPARPPGVNRRHAYHPSVSFCQRLADGASGSFSVKTREAQGEDGPAGRSRARRRRPSARRARGRSPARARCPRRASRRAGEALEHLRLLLGRDARAVVLDRELGAARRDRTAVPGGVCRSAFSTSARPICRTRCSSADDARAVDSASSGGRAAGRRRRTRRAAPRRPPRARRARARAASGPRRAARGRAGRSRAWRAARPARASSRGTRARVGLVELLVASAARGSRRARRAASAARARRWR